MRQPNPQGKGGSPTLELLQASRETALRSSGADSWQRLRDELAASLLVLSSKFQFKPVVGRSYHLYHHRGELLLSLVSPEEGGKRLFTRFLATCCLQRNYFWSIEKISRQGAGLLPTLLPMVYLQRAPDTPLQEQSPGMSKVKIGSYQGRLGYYQNILNYALGRSLTKRQELLLEAEADGASAAQLKGLHWLAPELPEEQAESQLPDCSSLDWRWHERGEE